MFLTLKRFEDNGDIGWWRELIKTNLRRTAKLVARGKFKDIILPGKNEGGNNFQRILEYTKNATNNALRNTLNTTIQDIAKIAINSPGAFAKNTICTGPNLLRILRSKPRVENIFNLFQDIASSGMAQKGNFHLPNRKIIENSRFE